MKILVTGGAGYVGAHSCKYFSQQGIEVVVLDNLSRGFREFVKWGPLIEVDLCDLSTCQTDLRHYGPYDGVLHCAAYAYVSEGEQHPELYFKNNVGGTMSLLHFIREQNIPQLVFSSSCTVYGEKVTPPVTVNNPLKPFSVYGQTKVFCEQAIREAAKATGLKFGLVRYFNAAGNDPEAEVYEKHAPELHLLPNIYRAVKSGSPLWINGNDYSTEDGTCVRDYVHVFDIARAHLFAFGQLSQQTEVVMNVGSGKGYSILEVVNAFQKMTGKKITTRFGKRRLGDIPAIYSDTTSGFKTTYSLEQIIKSTVQGFEGAGYLPDDANNV